MAGYDLGDNRPVLWWANGTERLPGPAAVRPGATLAELPAHLVPVLIELLRADTDLEACRRLNISPRTFSRRVAELLGHLGVRTRFQGGAEFALRGWDPAGCPPGDVSPRQPGRHPAPSRPPVASPHAAGHR